jgi:hypothetical protein
VATKDFITGTWPMQGVCSAMEKTMPHNLIGPQQRLFAEMQPGPDETTFQLGNLKN